ncbi:Fucosyltransferase-like protein [Actinidia chinensis var. chinensis]|uniref:Fucosyltransferase n=1 Tax=Actinidia chinensis var. chinensis TaxID=1590841 RepID=A0A2R6Q618_ACTCC|nr:Fucosyltransferase-like protein [Actinidia chinensis var. chinensis]
MSIVPSQRVTRPGWIHDEIPNSNGASSSNSNNTKKRFANLMPIFVVLVVIAEIAFLGRLDMAKNAALLADSFYQFTSSFPPVGDDEVSLGRSGVLGLDRSSEVDGCEEWLEREDSVGYSRDFEKEPVLVAGGDQEWKSCAVGCTFGFNPNKKPDAAFGLPQQPGMASVHRSMESSHYYSENNIATARGRGYSIVMTTSLSSDVPVGYFSWAEYDIMAPPKPKTEKALAAAFISNCGARNFRLQALEALEKSDMKIDSYGSCHRNRDGNVDKVETLKRYKFSLAFENSNEEDYVTEKFFQSLVAGRSSNLSPEALEYAVLSKFKSLKHIPIWKLERPESIRGGDDDELKVYRIYPVAKTQREALYTFRFKGDADFQSHIERNPCAKFEVVFV